MKECLSMFRTLLGSLALVVFLVAGVSADDQNKTKNTQGKSATSSSDQNKNAANQGKHKFHAKITKVDPKKGTVTVHMKDDNGKEVDRTFTLTQDAVMMDDTGRVATLDVFQSGNDVLIVEGEGRLKEMHKQRQGASTGSQNNNKNPDRK
jgi:hypothetical protein